jgi:Ca-activated chloride channel family protein
MHAQRSRWGQIVPAFLLIATLTACGAQSAAPIAQAPVTGTTQPPLDTNAQRLTNESAYAPGGTTNAYAAAPTVTTAAAGAGNGPQLAATDALSTFGLDVDTGSYTAVRNLLNAGRRPPAELVRVEEFLNYFHYDYPAPTQDTFGIYVDGAPSPFGPDGTRLVRVGIQGKTIDTSQRQDAVLTFVIDISGSMAQPNRLPLVKEALRLLVHELRQGDQVAIVVYGDTAVTVLEPTSADQQETILRAIDGLENGGSTNAEAGLQMGYKLAAAHFRPGAINRVILCSDGVANVGATGPDAIRQSIRDYSAQGVLLTTVGFGMGDYNDNLMEQLADDGNGNYAYVDSLDAARRIFVENLTGTLQVIAKDAKVQVDFNPDVVRTYRLLGYENRAVSDEDFRNDQVDAGEIGAGHSVTALYEITLTGQGQGPALTVQMRYADAKDGQVHELHQPFAAAALAPDFAATAPRFQLAAVVAGFAEFLRDSGDAPPRLTDLHAIGERLIGPLGNDADVQELLHLIEQASQVQP